MTASVSRRVGASRAIPPAGKSRRRDVLDRPAAGLCAGRRTPGRAGARDRRSAPRRPAQPSPRGARAGGSRCAPRRGRLRRERGRRRVSGTVPGANQSRTAASISQPVRCCVPPNEVDALRRPVGRAARSHRRPRPRATAGRDRTRARARASRGGRGRRRGRASASPDGHSSAQYGRNSSVANRSSSIRPSGSTGRRTTSVNRPMTIVSSTSRPLGSLMSARLRGDPSRARRARCRRLPRS